MKIAVIGAGNIGSTLAGLWEAAGHEVRIANGRVPESLADIAARTGATAFALPDVAVGVDVVSISVPFPAIASVAGVIRPAVGPAAVILDTGNYVPGARDAQIAALDVGGVESVWTQAHFDRPLVKAFNSIAVASLRSRGLPSGTPGRVALPMAGDDDAAKALVAQLVEAAGYDVVDSGRLAQSWRQQPGTPVYTADLDAAGVRQALAAAQPGQTAAWRAAILERVNP